MQCAFDCQDEDDVDLEVSFFDKVSKAPFWYQKLPENTNTTKSQNLVYECSVETFSKSRRLKQRFIALYPGFLQLFKNDKKEYIKGFLPLYNVRAILFYKYENTQYSAIKLKKNFEQFVLILRDLIILQKLMQNLEDYCILHQFGTKYNLQKLIGKGGNAKVYQSVRAKDNKECAVKVFNKRQLSKNSHSLESLISEIYLMRKLDHDNIIKLYEVYEIRDYIFIVMELLKGQNLLERLDKDGLPSEDEIKTILYQLLKGVEFMHKKNIMHRDLKLMNILFKTPNDYNELKIVDLGLATSIDLDKYLFLKCGTPGYMAPEVFSASQSKKYDQKCDLYSVGIILYIMMIGDSPFAITDGQDISDRNKEGYINLSCPDFNLFSKELNQLIKLLLIYDPKSRTSATDALNHEFFKHLQEYQLYNTEEDVKVNYIPTRQRTILEQEKRLSHKFAENCLNTNQQIIFDDDKNLSGFQTQNSNTSSSTYSNYKKFQQTAQEKDISNKMITTGTNIVKNNYQNYTNKKLSNNNVK